MALFTVQGRLKLLLNSEGSLSKNPLHCKLFRGSSSGGLLGSFGDFCSIYPFSLNDKYVKKNGYLRKWRILASSRDNISKSVNGNVETRLDYDDFDESDEEEDDDLSCFRGLVLDISYRPVNVVCWKRAICLEFMDKADVLEYYDQTVNSPSGSFNIPAVLRVFWQGTLHSYNIKMPLFQVPHLLQVVKRKRVRNTLSRKNIFYRDEYTCQYCSTTTSLTIDHVLPICRGGKWEWENLVTACARCNSKKGQKTLEEANMNLLKVPKAPKEYDILAIPLTSAAIRMLKIKKGTPEEWQQYLPK